MSRIWGAKTFFLGQLSSAASASTGSIHRSVKRKRDGDDGGSLLDSDPPFEITKRQKQDNGYYETTSVGSGDEGSGSRSVDILVC